MHSRSGSVVGSLLSLAVLVALPYAAGAAELASIAVKPQAVIGPVNPLLFGNNQLAYQGNPEYSAKGAGIWDPVKGAPVREFVELARQAGMTVARWPGGCESHRYNWKLTVGQHDLRPNQAFGLPEFLEWCEAAGARPILTVAEYWGEPSDGADLVEYLNAPNDGKHKWAALRAADGHPAPFNVIWFEYGNESDHGDHNKPPRIFTPKEYGQRYLAYQKAMKAVDPRIKLGAVIEHGNGAWDAGVLRICGRQMDFGIPHTYVPWYERNDGQPPEREVMLACVSADDAMQRMHDWLNELAYETCGRSDIPWAVTEYNGGFVQEKPVPYRQCLGNALRNAECLRIMMRPQNRVMCANFWQFANEYWGMVRGYAGGTIVKQANYFVYQLYHEHFGDTLVQADVKCGTFDFNGAIGVDPRVGKPQEFRLFEPNLLQDRNWKTSDVAGVKQTVGGDVVTAEFQGQDVNYYAPVLTMPAEPRTGYRVTGWIRTGNLRSATGACLQVGDARGWLATKSCSLEGRVTGTTDWTKVTVDYVTLADTTGITIQARRLEGGGAVTGRAEYKVEKVQRFTPGSAGAVPYVSCNAAKRKDGTITLVLLNKDLESDTPAEVALADVRSGIAAARAWSLTGPSALATNLGPDPHIGIVTTPATIDGRRVRFTLPKCSLTAVEIR